MSIKPEYKIKFFLNFIIKLKISNFFNFFILILIFKFKFLIKLNNKINL